MKRFDFVTLLHNKKVKIDGTDITLPRWVRTQGSPDDERARIHVYDAIKVIKENCRTKWGLPNLAVHLKDFIETGADVSYRPPEPWPDWK